MLRLYEQVQIWMLTETLSLLVDCALWGVHFSARTAECKPIRSASGNPVMKATFVANTLLIGVHREDRE